MGIFVNTEGIGEVYAGSESIGEIYAGTELVWQKAAAVSLAGTIGQNPSSGLSIVGWGIPAGAPNNIVVLDNSFPNPAVFTGDVFPSTLTTVSTIEIIGRTSRNSVTFTNGVGGFQGIIDTTPSNQGSKFGLYFATGTDAGAGLNTINSTFGSGFLINSSEVPFEWVTT
jgi:hypothetical protein